MGQKISLTDTATGSGIPYIFDDQVMGTGALVLTDFGHSLGGFSGVPVNTSVIPNVAWATANLLVAGAPGQAALSSKINGTSAAAPSYPLIERTPKLGLHAIRSQASDIAGALYNLEAASAIETYMVTNRAHAFYVSYWDYFTRGGTTNLTPFGGVMAMLMGNTSNYLVDEGYGPSVSQRVGPLTSGLGLAGSTATGRTSNLATGACLMQWGANGYTGTYGAATAILPYIFGGTGASWVGLHIGASQILYRSYIEDMTVSAAAGGYANNGAITVAQRFAELIARDAAMYNASFNTSGTYNAADAAGNVKSFVANARFNGDTFTAPSGYP